MFEKLKKDEPMCFKIITENFFVNKMGLKIITLLHWPLKKL